MYKEQGADEDEIIVTASETPRPHYTLVESVFSPGVDMTKTRFLKIHFEILETNIQNPTFDFQFVTGGSNQNFQLYHVVIPPGKNYVVIDLESPKTKKGNIDMTDLTKYRITVDKAWKGKMRIGTIEHFSIGKGRWLLVDM